MTAALHSPLIKVSSHVVENAWRQFTAKKSPAFSGIMLTNASVQHTTEMSLRSSCVAFVMSCVAWTMIGITSSVRNVGALAITLAAPLEYSENLNHSANAPDLESETRLSRRSFQRNLTFGTAFDATKFTEAEVGVKHRMSVASVRLLRYATHAGVNAAITSMTEELRTE